MANQITDNRTLLDNANTTTNFSGSTSPAQDTEIFIYDGGGTGASVAEQITNSLRWVMYNAGSAQNWSNNHFYIWINCGIVGLLDTKTNGGFRIRFAGTSTTDFFEVYVGGSDEWPNAIAGGWVQFVVDIEDARTAATTNGWTGGTPPATSAIQYVGYAAVTGGTMTRAADNTWMDALWRLPATTPGIIVEGRNAGTTDWSFADIYTQLTIQSGAFKLGPSGSYVLNAPLQIGINDTTTHGFADTNQTIFWDDQEYVAADHYVFSALGNAGGTTNITLGIKSGTGTAATGAQGITFQAASTGARWTMDLDDANLDTIGLYGCNFVHADVLELDTANIDLASCLFLDCSQANVSNATIVRATVVDANTVDGEAFMVTDDFSDIVNSNFFFSDGHAIELNAATPTSQNNVGNQFSGYTNTVNSTDAAILNSASGSLTISSSGGSNLNTSSYRNTGGGSTTITNNISVTLTGMKDNTEVRVYTTGTTTELAGTENATSGTTNNRSFTFSLSAATVVDIAIFNVSWIFPPNNRVTGYTVPGSDSSLPITQIFDRNYNNP